MFIWRALTVLCLRRQIVSQYFDANVLRPEPLIFDYGSITKHMWLQIFTLSKIQVTNFVHLSDCLAYQYATIQKHKHCSRVF